MRRQIFSLLLLAALAFPFYGTTGLTQMGSASQAGERGKRTVINPEGKTPFPYLHSFNKALTDRSGCLWFATTDGVYRYDGKLFTNYRVMDGMQVGDVSAMMEDKSGNIWFGTRQGIVRYDLSSSQKVDSPSFVSIKIQVADSIDRLARANDGSGQLKEKKPVTHMIQDRSGTIWFCAGYDVYRTEGRLRIAIKTSVGDFLKSEKVQYHCKYPDDFGICGIYEDRQGNILLSTIACSCGPSATYRITASRTDHLCLLNHCRHNMHNRNDTQAHQGEITASFSKILKDDGGTNIAFSAVLEDRSGTVWIGSDRGVYKYNGIGFTSLTKGDTTLSKSIVSTIYEDAKGNIWFGTAEGTNFHGNGAFRYDPSAPRAGAPAITHYTAKDGLCNAGAFKSDILYAILEDNTGRVWFSGDGGACYYNDKAPDSKGSRFTSLTEKEGLNSHPVNFITKDKAGNLWLGTWELGLYRYDGKTLVCFTENKPGL